MSHSATRYAPIRAPTTLSCNMYTLLRTSAWAAMGDEAAPNK